MAAAEEGARRLLESIEDNKRHTKVVQAWLTKHNDPMYVTDLWFVVKEGEKEIRIPRVLRNSPSDVRPGPRLARNRGRAGTRRPQRGYCRQGCAGLLSIWI